MKFIRIIALNKDDDKLMAFRSIWFAGATFEAVMIKIELTETQFEALSKKKLADVVNLMNVVETLSSEYPNYVSFLEHFLTNEPVDIVYNGGSNAGTQRRIVPQSIKHDGSFRAFCVDSDSSKAFKLERVELV
ncbi:hypothetical protein QNE60_005083 [Vibrio harveyi]|nr:hypothetical protein [Vibrio harveyi]